MLARRVDFTIVYYRNIAIPQALLFATPAPFLIVTMSKGALLGLIWKDNTKILMININH